MVLKSFIGSLSATLGKPITLVLILVVGGAGLVSLYFWDQNQKTQAELSQLKGDPKAVAQEEVKSLVAKVEALAVLPGGEEPTVATVTDIEKLKEQPFFAKAQNGDKVLIYTQAKKAYLYSSRMNKILEIAPVNIGNDGQPQQGEVAGTETKE